VIIDKSTLEGKREEEQKVEMIEEEPLKHHKSSEEAEE
jgi:hypothetical protein